MAVERGSEQSVSAIVGGIVADVQNLARQEIALAREEIKEELNTAKTAGIKLGIGVGVLVIGALFLLIFLALGLADLLNIPAWGGFGIVGLVFAIAGAVLLVLGRKDAENIQPVPTKTVETMKENVEWIKDRTTSDKT